MSHPRTARSLLLALLLLTTIGSTHAQDVRHRNFELDSLFRIGCHLLQLPRLAHDSLWCEFSQFYYTDLSTVRQQILAPTSLFDTLVRDFYLNADDSTLDYKVIFNLSHFADLYQQARAVDVYPWVDQAVQGSNFPGINTTQGTIDSVGPAGLLGALRIPRVSPAITVLMAQGTRFVSTEGFFTGDSAHYARWGLDPDSTHFLKIVVALDVPDEDLDDLDNPDTLLYVDLYRRIDTLQSNTCRCNLYEKFQMLPVTKSAYQAAMIDPITGYHEVAFWLDMRGGRWLDSSDMHYYHSRRGTWFGWPTNTTQCTQECADLLLKLRDTLAVVDTSAIHFPVIPEGSDLTCRVFTTRKATVSLFRVRFAMHALDALERGDLDDWLRADLDTLFTPQDTLMGLIRRRVMRFSIHDEPFLPVYRQASLMAMKMQEFLDDVSPNDRRGLFQNPVNNFDGWRLFTGDLDTTRTRPKPAHMICRQLYVNIPSIIPIFYANPDSCDDKALRTYYPATETTLTWGTDTIDASKRIALNTRTDYDRYTREQQEQFGAYFDHSTSATQAGGVIVPHLARAVHVGRGKYSAIGADTCVVWNVVQAAGWLPEAAGGDPRGYSGVWSLIPATGEVITVQTFLTLNCGADGLLWHDISWDGANFGVCDWITGDHAKEYDSGFTGNHVKFQGDPKWVFPKMWVGFASRFAAIQRVGRELRQHLLPVYDRLQRPGSQMSVFDTRQSFAEIPMIDTLITGRARVDSLDGSGGYIDAGTADRHDSTYIELTVFQPKTWYDTGVYRNSTYALITNRRTFPNDTLRYSSRTTARGGDSVGLGYIDVRRPVVVLKNTTRVIADSVHIERIGDTTWSIVAPFGQQVGLEWLEPGWGHMYRLTPIPRGVSSLGTAYNNAVRAVNPSLDTLDRPRFVVYERDSIVYLRTLSADRGWSIEHRVSASVDAEGATRAYNINPAVSTVRNGNSALIVWERRTPGDTAEIRAMYLRARNRRSVGRAS